MSLTSYQTAPSRDFYFTGNPSGCAAILALPEGEVKQFFEKNEKIAIFSLLVNKKAARVRLYDRNR